MPINRSTFEQSERGEYAARGLELLALMYLKALDIYQVYFVNAADKIFLFSSSFSLDCVFSIYTHLASLLCIFKSFVHVLNASCARENNGTVLIFFS